MHEVKRRNGVFRPRFLLLEFPTGDQHPGRIDSLGLDENDTPLIIEYELRQPGGARLSA